MSVDEIDFSVRANNVLGKSRIMTMYELISMDYNSFLSLDGLGNVVEKEIINKIIEVTAINPTTINRMEKTNSVYNYFCDYADANDELSEYEIPLKKKKHWLTVIYHIS